MPDLLEGTIVDSEPSEGPIISGLFSDNLVLLREIRNELRKSHPSVLVTARLEDGAPSITDTNAHRILFTVAGMEVPIYKLIITKGDYNPAVKMSFRPFQAGVSDGITVSAGVMEFSGCFDTLYVRANALTNGQLRINDGDGVNGGLSIYAFTTEEQAFSYQPDRR